MGKLILIEPGKEPRMVGHVGPVTLDDLHRYLGDVTVDCVNLGTIPPRGRRVDLWIDDNGLLNDAAPNRLLPNGTLICGTMLLCTVDEEGNSLPLHDEEAGFLLNDVQMRWEAMPADADKPAPEWTIRGFDGAAEALAAIRPAQKDPAE